MCLSEGIACVGAPKEPDLFEETKVKVTRVAVSRIWKQE